MDGRLDGSRHVPASESRAGIVSDVEAFDARQLRSAGATVVPPTRLASARSLPVLAIAVLFVTIVTAGVVGAQHVGAGAEKPSGSALHEAVVPVMSPRESSRPAAVSGTPAPNTSMAPAASSTVTVGPQSLVVIDRSSADVLRVSVNGDVVGQLYCPGSTLEIDSTTTRLPPLPWTVHVERLPNGGTDVAKIGRLPYGLEVTDGDLAEVDAIPASGVDCAPDGSAPPVAISRETAEATALALDQVTGAATVTAAHLLEQGRVDELLPLSFAWMTSWSADTGAYRWVWVVDLHGSFDVGCVGLAPSRSSPAHPDPSCPPADGARIIVDAMTGEMVGRAFYLMGN